MKDGTDDVDIPPSSGTVPPVIEIWESQADGKWYFHKKARNGEITSASQGYKRKQYAVEAARRDFPGVYRVFLEREPATV